MSDTNSPFCTLTCGPSSRKPAGLQQRHTALLTALLRPHSTFEVPDFTPLQDFESSQGRGQAQHPPTTHVSMEDRSDQQGGVPSSLTSQISLWDKGQRGLAWKDQMLGLGPRRLKYGASSLRFKVPLTYINEAMSRGQQLGQGWLCPSDFCLLYLLWVPPGPSLSFITGSMLGL